MYARYFHDSLKSFTDTLATEAPADAGPGIAGADLVAGRALDDGLRVFADQHGIGAHRAVATEWSKYFFAHLIIPVVVVQTGAGRRLDLAPENWRAYYRDDGTITRFVFDRDPLTGPAAPGDMASLIDDVMTPLIDALTANCGLAPRVFASNAAMYYAWALDQMAARHHLSAGALAPARALLDSPSRPDGGWNPFHAPFKTLPAGALDGNGEPARQCRRLCCVRDLEPGLALCANCPRAITYAAPGSLAANALR